MRAGQTTLKRLIEGEKQYRVPLFQRPYTWEGPQLRQLWADLLAQYEVLSPGEGDGVRPQRSGHFLGSFVLAPVPGLASGVSTHLVVDGQQRLITLLLALAALRDAHAGGDDRAVERYNQLYLRNEYRSGLDRYKLLPSRLDRDDFFSCIDGKPPEDAAASKIAAAYRFFVAQLAKPGPGGEEQSIDLSLLERIIVEHLAVVDITTEPEDNPHRIFESLNYTGVSLTQADLLRNYLFMLLPTRAEQIYDEVWLPMEAGLGADNLEGLARVDLQRRGMDATKDDVYRLHQERLEPISHDEVKVVAEIRELARHAQFYRRLIDPGAEPNLQVRASLTRLKRWGAQTTYPLLMHIYDLVDQGKASADDLAQSLVYIESFIVRRHLARIPTNQLNRLFADMIKQLDPGGPVADEVRKALSGERPYWPTDDQIRQVVRTEPFYIVGRYDQRKLILERIEASYGHRDNRHLHEATVWGRKQILERADELAERIVEIWPAPLPGAKGAPTGFDWGRIDAAVAAIPAGRWTTYGDLAELGGTAAQAVGNRMASGGKLKNAYRVLDRSGRISPAFRWGDASDKRDPRHVLESEGIEFDAEGQAKPVLRLSAYDLAQLIPYEFESDELERLRGAQETPRAMRIARAGDDLWLRDGRAWHLEHVCSAKTRDIGTVGRDYCPGSSGRWWTGLGPEVLRLMARWRPDMAAHAAQVRLGVARVPACSSNQAISGTATPARSGTASSQWRSAAPPLCPSNPLP